MAEPYALHEGHGSGFWRHFAEMIVAMAVGMFVGLAIYLTAIGMMFDEALTRHPIAILIVVAVSMTVPMVAWMRHRGHGWRSCSEMAAAMVVPVIPFLCLVWFNVTESALCGGYCSATVVAMLVVMSYRRSEYAMAMH
ncbi:MAG: hypothetical protein ACXWXS_05720 [Actinomycetota bacterium]